MTLAKKPIGLIPIGDIPEITSKSIAAHILGYYNLDVDILSHQEHPAYAYDEKRMQYNAGDILQAIESGFPENYEKVLAVVDVDIFVPILTHVFGEAFQGGCCALVSIYRLKRNSDGSTAQESLYLERAAKVALHELGHLLNLRHCMDGTCLMHFSGGLEDLDHAPFHFCRHCSVFLQDALHRLP
ncbi:archaemetzincin family Zn-dependent metalloprotease [Thermodesulfobacteriota bacterium]